MVSAIRKGNLSLLPLAFSRMEYLRGVIDHKLLGKGLEGDEEALCSIHEYPHNGGLWERARDLIIQDPIISET